MAEPLTPITRRDLANIRAALGERDRLARDEPGRATHMAAQLMIVYGARLVAALDALLPLEAPEGHTLTHCTKCEALIVMSRHARTGHPAPIEVAVSEKGNCLLQADGTYTIISRPDARADYKGRLHLNHFATCPSAAEFGQR